MRSSTRYLLLTIVCLLGSVADAVAQHIAAQAPARVAAGENFRLSYTIATQDVEDFRAGNIPAGLEVIAGPYTSTQSSYQIVNGHASGSSSITYTYTLYAAHAGTYTIPPAHARINGHVQASRPLRVVVSGAAHNTGSAPRMHQDDSDEPRMRQAGEAITGNDLFIKVEANKRRVHEQEPVLLTYKVFTQVDLTQLEGKMPDLTGFHTQEVKLPQQKSFHLERVDGRPYRCVTWSQYVMYPQMTGRLEIPSITFKGIVVQENRSVDPFEAFFNGGSGYIEVHRNINAPGMTIQVDPLPQKPAGFSGGVGRFNISAQLSKTEVKAGDPITLRIVVGGTGNLKLIKQPVVDFPKDFDKYDPKVTDKTRLTAHGVEGNMVYDFLVVPRNQGTFTIPAASFIYYDTQAEAYRTLTTQPFTVTVEKGDGKNTTASYEEAADNDIHGIKRGDAVLTPTGDCFFGSTAYWLTLVALIAVFAALLVVFRRRALENADIVKVRGRKANKMARRRLRRASQLMFRGRRDEFYDEVLRALWGYAGYKLNMPAEALSRDNISERLASRGVDEGTVATFLSALDECELERYAPGDAKGNMDRTLTSAMTAITDIENVMKKRKSASRDNDNASHGNDNASHAGGAAMLLLLLVAMLPMAMHAVTKQNADTEYQRGHYQQAIADYKEILRRGASAEVYYNLGNAYYRTDSLAQAILAYERAYEMEPGDADIRFNLQFARSKTIDKITPESEMFFVTWYRSLVSFTGVDQWAWTAVASIVVALVLLLLFLFAPSITVRKVSFFSAVVLLALFFVANLFAWQQRREVTDRSDAIVMSPSVSVKKTPEARSADAFVLHEGTRVDITDQTIAGWAAIRLADGREGWVSVRALEKI